MSVEHVESVTDIATAVLRLSIARGGGVLDDITGDVYVRGLMDLRADLVTEACDDLGLEPREDFKPAMPTVADIRARVDRIAREAAARDAAAKLLPAPVSEPDERPYFCLDCRDEPHAWRAFWCAGIGSAASRTGPTDPRRTVCPCSRRHPHAHHGYVERCQCADVNPIIAEHRRRIASFQEQRQERRR